MQVFNSLLNREIKDFYNTILNILYKVHHVYNMYKRVWGEGLLEFFLNVRLYGIHATCINSNTLILMICLSYYGSPFSFTYMYNFWYLQIFELKMLLVNNVLIENYGERSEPKFFDTILKTAASEASWKIFKNFSEILW